MPQLMLVNPAKRRKSRKKTSSRKRRSRVRRNPVKRAVARRSPSKARRVSRRKYRRNPIKIGGRGMLKRTINQQVMPAVTQAGGALAVDLGYGYLSGYLPAMLTTGMARHATKGVMAVLLSTIAANFVKSSTANAMAVGALTVTIHDAAKEVLATAAPQLPLGYYNPGYVQSLSYYPSTTLPGAGLGEYMNTGMNAGFNTAYDDSINF
jgi:hypothetical protein